MKLSGDHARPAGSAPSRSPPHGRRTPRLRALRGERFADEGARPRSDRAGNTGAVTRKFLSATDGRLQATRAQIGGMYTRALCEKCNNRAGGEYDPSYGEFHAAVEASLSVAAAGLARTAAFAGIIAVPASVARSVLCGAFSLNTRMRIVMPDAATDLQSGAQRVRWSPDWRLLLALNSGVHRVEGGMSGLRLLPPRVHRSPAAEIWFPPLAWALVPAMPVPTGLGPSYFDLTKWVDVTSWINLTRQAPFVIAEALAASPHLDSYLLPGDSAEVWSLVYAPGDAAIVLGDRGTDRR